MEPLSLRKQKQQRRDYLRRLASMKQAAPENRCRAWIAILGGAWHWTGPEPIQLRQSQRP